MLNKKIFTIIGLVFFVFLVSLLALIYINRPSSFEEKESFELLGEADVAPEHIIVSNENAGFLKDFQEIIDSDEAAFSKLEVENFCLKNFDFGTKSSIFLQKIEENKEKSIYATSLFDNYGIFSAIYSDGKIDCSGDNNDVCRKIQSLKDLNSLINSRDNSFCRNYDDEVDDELICGFLNQIVENKYIYLTDEIKSQVCSVDRGFPGVMIKYNDTNSSNQECMSDGGQIFNIILATVNSDLSYCENIKDSRHNLNKLSCSFGALGGDSDLTMLNYSKYFCKAFSDAVRD